MGENITLPPPSPLWEAWEGEREGEREGEKPANERFFTDSANLQIVGGKPAKKTET